MTSLVVVAWVFTALLLVMVVVGMLAARGAIPVNHIVGVRVPSVMRDETAWRAGHAASVLPAAFAFAVALVCSVIGLSVTGAYWGSLIAFVGGVAVVFVRASRAARSS